MVFERRFSHHRHHHHHRFYGIPQIIVSSPGFLFHIQFHFIFVLAKVILCTNTCLLFPFNAFLCSHLFRTLKKNKMKLYFWQTANILAFHLNVHVNFFPIFFFLSNSWKPTRKKKKFNWDNNFNGQFGCCFFLLRLSCGQHLWPKSGLI